MEHLRISACTYPVRDRPLDVVFRLFADAGFRKIDLWGGPPNYSVDPDECDPRALRDTAAQFGLTIANLSTYPGREFLADDSNTREYEMEVMRRTIDLARFLGARSIRVSPGRGEDPAIVEPLVPLFREAADYAEEKEVGLGMENHKGSIAGCPEVCMELVRRVGSPFFGVLYEPANLMQAGVDYRQAYETFRGAIVHVHVKDSRVRGGRYERTVLGRGDVDIPWIVSRLAEDGYRGDFALEYEIGDKVPIEHGLPRWFEYFAAIDLA
ncbi:MAG: sugar phosphate isomerase/epimerase [Kiritimatiellaeota bacterium]|nr:sugar phosphate isomerase/epimerase [Kiritimatiellota bacterium]